MEPNIINAHNDLRNNKVDMLSTKDNNMKQRRVINAAPAQDANDYIIKDQLDKSTSGLQDQLDKLINSFSSGWKYIAKIVTTAIKPPRDSTTAIQVLQADGSTPVLTIDTVDNFVGFGISPPTVKVDVYGSIITRGVDSTVPMGVPYGRLCYDVTNNLFDILSYNSTTGFQELVIRGTPLLLGTTGGKIGFYGTTTPALKQVLNSYSPNPQSAYSGIVTGTGGTPYAQVSDLNNLRTAVENLRLMCEDLRSKLQGSTLVG